MAGIDSIPSRVTVGVGKRVSVSVRLKSRETLELVE